jgi:hypothetical protein
MYLASQLFNFFRVDHGDFLVAVADNSACSDSTKVKCNARNEKVKPEIRSAGNAKAFALLSIARVDDWRYSDLAYSQGGAKFPTGGKSASAESPRALSL